MSNEDPCTAEAPCHLDATPYLTHPRNSAWEFAVRCSKCNSTWWTYRTPRWHLARQAATAAK